MVYTILNSNFTIFIIKPSCLEFLGIYKQHRREPIPLTKAKRLKLDHFSLFMGLSPKDKKKLNPTQIHRASPIPKELNTRI